MELWRELLGLVNNFRNVFSRERIFLWFILALIGFIVKSDFAGVTSLARGAGLLPQYYTCLLNFFHSSSINLNKLKSCWCNLALKIFSTATVYNGHKVIIGDGVKIGKSGKHMPAVKLQHQSSGSLSNSISLNQSSPKPASIIIKTFLALGIQLDNAFKNFFALFFNPFLSNISLYNGRLLPFNATSALNICTLCLSAI